MTTTSRAQRTASRTVHILVALVLGTIVYAPSYIAEPLMPVAQFVAIPAAIVTGIFLWKQGRIRQLLSSRNRRQSSAT
ncbi:hypothetical protein QSU92_12080 [Microbacterium sp. ET2]|uniref:hypothetical protein n=1 Tax=Microbacterium albipurpureum TaxID=3050384 RepID=UPI00259CB55A|nr:hypothetical protein [Microbacterium sp. ET2 (Ac-2212)]WJL94702.1 hypothetical protein QSU92_12080 [Microbacterium sp. ET2 (Ac-2212)]